MRGKELAVASGFLLLVGSAHSQKTAVQDDQSTKTMQTPISDPKDVTGPAHPIPVPPPRVTASAPAAVTDRGDSAVDKTSQKKKASKKTDPAKKAKSSSSASGKPGL